MSRKKNMRKWELWNDLWVQAVESESGIKIQFPTKSEASSAVAQLNKYRREHLDEFITDGSENPYNEFSVSRPYEDAETELWFVEIRRDRYNEIVVTPL